MLPSADGGPRGSLAYKYVIHEDLLPLIGSNNVLLEETDTYEWALKSWAPCTKACGGGTSPPRPGCPNMQLPCGGHPGPLRRRNRSGQRADIDSIGRVPGSCLSFSWKISGVWKPVRVGPLEWS